MLTAAGVTTVMKPNGSEAFGPLRLQQGNPQHTAAQPVSTSDQHRQVQWRDQARAMAARLLDGVPVGRRSRR